MTIQHYFSAALLFCFSLNFAQEKTIDTVYIFDRQLTTAKTFHKTATLKEEDLLKNTTNLSDVLRFQSPVFIKENGRGMVSSPAFRGTTAQQTAFVWNGVNINSILLGQGDINNLNLLGYDQLEIKSGGGSVIYGSGAIGGSIHLNNDLSFDQSFRSSLFVETASYNTFNALLKTSYSDEKLSVKVSGNFVKSDNDYEVPEKKYINLNGAYDNRTFNLGAAYRINRQNTVAWQTHLYDGVQNFPTSEFGTKTKYLTQTFRSLLDWNYRSKKLTNILKAAYLQDEFQYFENSDQPKSSGGTGETYLAKNDFSYLINDQIAINLIGEYKIDQAEGYSSGITSERRKAGSAAALMRWNPTKYLYFEGGIKKDMVERMTSPLLLSFSSKLKMNKWYDTSLNMSKNFRYPSFNDLYWKEGGNPDLKPEISHQVEMGHHFKISAFKLNITPYYIRIRDMIRWLPTSHGYWSPVNTNKVESYGVESQLSVEKSFARSKATGSLGYVYTHSKNLDSDKLLMYVPEHKIFGNAGYRYRGFELYMQGMFNGLTYTDSNEKLKDALQPYFVVNGGLNITFLKYGKIGFKVNNIFDQIYETVRDFPLPKRNYSTNFSINF